MKLIHVAIALFIVAFIFIATKSDAAVVGAGDLRWEMIHEDQQRIIKYNLDSVTTYPRNYTAEVWMYTKFKTPVKGKMTESTDGKQVEVKYIFQRLIFNCQDMSYNQKEFIVFRWEDEAKVGHLQTNETYQIVSNSPMDKLRGIVCYTKRNH